MTNLNENNDKRIICPNCNIEVPPTKAPSVAGVMYFSWVYVFYYYLFKKRICPICYYKFNKEELKEFDDPDSQWKTLSIAAIILFVLAYLFSIFYGGY